jgi:hypothetical protein
LKYELANSLSCFVIINLFFRYDVFRIGLPRLLLDSSNFASSTELRRMINARKSIESRSLLVFPDILD